MKREPPLGGSRLDPLRRPLEGDSASRMKIDLDAEDSRSSGSSSCTTRHRRKGKGKTSERARRPTEKHPHELRPLLHLQRWRWRTARIAESPGAARWEWPEPAAEEAMAPLQTQVERVYHLPAAAGRVLRADPRRDLDSIRETKTRATTCESAQVPIHPASGMDPQEEDCQMADRPEDPQEEDHQEDHQKDHQEHRQAADHQAEHHLEDHQVVTP